ncbi:50S ribosomal protein L11 methyltransferase, partial [Acinetobacter baumannii]
ATDIDPVAVEVTLENLKSNKVELEVRVADRVPQGAWDVAVSNIISATLIRLTPTMRNAVRSGGVWILSGVIEDNWHDVRDVA